MCPFSDPNTTGNQPLFAYIPTSTEAVVGQNTFVVWKIQFGKSDRVSVFLNPSTLAGAAPATPTVAYNSVAGEADLSFRTVGLNSVAVQNLDFGSLDELRFGDSFAAVTPINITLPTPILQYRFNESLNSAFQIASTGWDTTPATLRDNTGAPANRLAAGGVSGLAGDKHFDNSAATANGYPNGAGRADHSADNLNLGGLQSFTLCGWLKRDSLSGAGDLFHKYSWGTNQGFIFYVNGSRLNLNVNNKFTHSVDAPLLTTTGNWVFFAATFDTSQSAHTNFYVGSPGAQTTNLPLLVLPTNPGAAGTNTVKWAMGNQGNGHVFDGLLDNLRVYGSKTDASGALSQAQLEAIRQKDVLNLP